MKKSRIIALFLAAMMIMSAVPAYAAGYFIGEDGTVYEKDGENLVANASFENGLTGLTSNSEYYEVSQEAAHSGEYSLKAIKSTKGDGAITAYFAVENPLDSYYLSFWYKNTDTIARRPRVTFAFADADKVVTEDENTNAWIGAGTASNDQDMEYSKGEWVQYSTVINGTGSANDCSYVVLNIYGLTKNVSFVDDFEIYALAYSEEYGDKMAAAIANWEKVTMPKGPLAGIGTLSLATDTGVDGIGVEWISTSEAIDTETGAYKSGAEEELVILTARLYAEDNSDIYFDFEYPYIVKSMFVPYIEWIKTEVFPKIGSAIDSDLSLPSTHSIAGYPEAEITWSCSDETVLDADGKFTAPEVTGYVDIVATITCSGVSATTTKRVKALGGNLVPNGLIMYYDFEKALGGKDTLYDNSKSATTYNAKVEGITLTDGYAKFSGSASTIKLPANYATELTGSYSVSMWVKVDKSIASSSGMYRFFDFGGGTYTSQFLRFIPGSGQLTFMDRGTADNGSDWAIDTTVSGFGDTWKFVTFTYNMDSDATAFATVYVDGEEVANCGTYSKLTNSIYNIATASSTTGFIGRTQWNNGDNPDFMGYMDDVRIYNRAITLEEVETLYENTRPTVTAPITIKFQDINGEALKDDETVSADVDTTYDVPASYKSIPSTTDDQYRYVYKYIASKSTDSVYVSSESDNVCILVFELEKQPKGTNLLENGSFENGTTGWTNRLGTDITGATVEYESSIGANVMKIATQGKSSTQNIGTAWNVEAGKDYTISFDIYTGAVLTADNYQYNRLSDAYALGDVGQRENSGSDIIAWGASLAANSWTHFEKSFTAATDVLYFQSSWSAGEMWFANFILEEAGEEDKPAESGYKIVIKYKDVDGNTIKDDVPVTASLDKNEYTVPDNYKSIATETSGDNVYMYIYKEDLSTVTINPSQIRENICTLVFDAIAVNTATDLAEADNLVPDGGFKGEDGKFSWGTWQSPETQGYFKNTCQDWFYQVNRDTNEAALYLTGITADDYALGTRWNDGLTGLCSMANFIPVEAGKTYVVSYDYKHTNPSAAQEEYITVAFQKNKMISGGNNDQGNNIPAEVSTDWKKNTFAIYAPEDGYIYFHFSWLGESNNGGSGPFWYFDNVGVYEVKPEILEAEIKSVGDTETQVKLSNISEDEEDVLTLTVYAASYTTDGIMTAVDSVNVTLGAGESETVTLGVGNAATVKAFLWETDETGKVTMQSEYKTLIFGE